jgi:hypothetical protein
MARLESSVNRLGSLAGQVASQFQNGPDRCGFQADARVLVCLPGLLQWHDHTAVLGNRIVGCLVDPQVRHDRFRRGMSQPLRER